ncbi:hypothetical protein V6Z77_010218 [Aspergillus fumigatus]
MPPAGHAGIRRGRRPCACRCKGNPADGARLSGADKGARAPANWSPLAPPVSVWVSRPGSRSLGARRPTGHPPVPASVSLGQRLSMARALACRRPACPRGSRQLVTLAARPRGAPAAPTRPANWPPRARLRASPSSSSPALLALLALLAPRPPRPPSPSRARLSARLEGARLPGPQPPQPTPLNRDPRAPPAALLLHIPTDLARPIIVRANVPGSERRSGGGEAHLRRQTARRPCGHVPQPTGHCPSSPGGGGARVPAAISAGQLARVHGGGDPEGTGRHRCPPASPGERCLGPLRALALPGPLMGGVCQQI